MPTRIETRHQLIDMDVNSSFKIIGDQIIREIALQNLDIVWQAGEPLYNDVLKAYSEYYNGRNEKLSILLVVLSRDPRYNEIRRIITGGISHLSSYMIPTLSTSYPNSATTT